MNDPDDFRKATIAAAPIDQILSAARPVVSRSPAVTYTLRDDDLDHGIPSEYRAAQLAPAVRAMLEADDVSVTLIGPPGTGKTYQAWAALRAHRRKRCGHLVGKVASWIVRSDAPKRTEWVGKCVEPDADRFRIISESGDIMRHRFDRAWLDLMSAFPYWLIVDDIGYAEGGDWPVEAVYHLANERRAWNRPTMWTTNLTAQQLREIYSPAIASRLLGGIVRELDGKDRRIGC